MKFSLFLNFGKKSPAANACLRRDLFPLCKMKNALARLTSKEAREQYALVKQVEKDLLDALKEKGYEYRSGKIVSAVLRDEEDEEKEKATEAVDSEDGVRFSYAGENSKTANKSMLQKAKEMERSGKSSEEIRKETGWFKSYDGKWRYEIDDSDLTILERKDGLSIYLTDGEYTLPEVISHKKLFEAYPALKDLKVVVSSTGFGKNVAGYYNEAQNEIRLNRNVYLAEEQLKQLFSHELQHWIQRNEGFARGSNPQYWERRGISEEEYNSFRAKAEQEYQKELSKLSAQDRATVKKYFEVDRKLGNALDSIDFSAENAAEMLEKTDALEKESDQYYKIISGKEWFDRILDIHNQMEEAISQKLYTIFYKNTAGEIEARDVSSRLKMSPQKRQTTRPDIDRTDVVFAEGVDKDNSTKYNYIYTREQYQKFGWARYASAISKSELDDLYSKIKEKTSLRSFNQSSRGEAIVEVNNDPNALLGVDNVFVFVKGTKNNFEITRVIRFNAETEAEMDIYREVLYERRSWSDTYCSFFIQQGLAKEYSRERSQLFEQYQQEVQGRRSGQGSGETDWYYRESREQRGRYSQNSGENEQDIRFSRSAQDSTDSAAQAEYYNSNREYAREILDEIVSNITDVTVDEGFAQMYYTEPVVKHKSEIADLVYAYSKETDSSKRNSIANKIADKIIENGMMKVSEDVEKDLLDRANAVVKMTVQKHFFSFENFFTKSIDKPWEWWYNTPVIRRQQVPVKAYAFLPRSDLNVLRGSAKGVFESFFTAESACRRKDFLFFQLHTGGETECPAIPFLLKSNKLLPILQSRSRILPQVLW